MRTALMKAMCEACPVQAECLDFGLNEHFGTVAV
jgi:hypothetical protein